MADESLQEKLQRGYHAMLETVEALVEKEGKSVRDAVYSAEEKLSEWEELSKEEISNISGEIQEDLKELGETLYGAKKAFREQARMDAHYLAEATWDKLSEIADKSTVQLIQFKEALQENVREISEELHEDEHHDHQKWHSQHALWLDEINLWQKEHEEAQYKIEGIQQAINKLNVALGEHRQAIQSHEQVTAEHERIIADVEKDPTSRVAEEREDQEEAIHKQERAGHNMHAEFHAKAKAHHRTMMSLISKLEKHMREVAE